MFYVRFARDFRFFCHLLCWRFGRSIATTSAVILGKKIKIIFHWQSCILSNRSSTEYILIQPSHTKKTRCKLCIYEVQMVWHSFSSAKEPVFSSQAKTVNDILLTFRRTCSLSFVRSIIFTATFFLLWQWTPSLTTPEKYQNTLKQRKKTAQNTEEKHVKSRASCVDQRTRLTSAQRFL